MPTDDTLYDVLGVARTATPEELRSAYRRRLMQTHPDQGGDAALFRRVQRAFETLSDPVLRRIYDEELGGSEASGPHAQDPAGSVDDLFGPGSRWREERTPRRPAPEPEPAPAAEGPPTTHYVRAPAPASRTGSFMVRFGLPAFGLGFVWSGGAGWLPTIVGHASVFSGWLDGLAGGVLAAGVTALRLRLRRRFRLGVIASATALGFLLGGVLLELEAFESGLNTTMLVLGALLTAAAARDDGTRRRLLGLDPVPRRHRARAGRVMAPRS